MKPLRCAVYTRKSTEDGLGQEFNSLNVQREACEAYIRLQRHEGWVLAPNRYDDGWFTGGTMDRSLANVKITFRFSEKEIHAQVPKTRVVMNPH